MEVSRKHSSSVHLGGWFAVRVRCYSRLLCVPAIEKPDVDLERGLPWGPPAGSSLQRLVLLVTLSMFSDEVRRSPLKKT